MGSEGCASCKAVNVGERGDEWDGPPGSFRWSQNASPAYRTLWFKLPNGAHGMIAIEPMPLGSQVRDKEGVLRPASWHWDGNVEQPTLRPSIRHGKPGDSWYWHGHLKKGFFEGC